VRGLSAAVRIELLKLRRTLALATCFVAPLVVAAFQVAVWLRREEGFGADVEPWLSFHTNVLTMWAIFMLPLTTALVVALVHHAEHANQGWLRLGVLPLPRWVVPAAKALVATGLLLLATGVLVLGCLGGAVLADALHPKIALETAAPVATMLGRTARVFGAALLVLAIQNAVSLRFPSIVVSLGTGVAGTFLALFASGSKLGPYYPWLMPLHAVHGKEEAVVLSVALGAAGGLLVLALTVALAARRDPGLKS
jgi:ABC-2 type transport system permease protein